MRTVAPSLLNARTSVKKRRNVAEGREQRPEFLTVRAYHVRGPEDAVAEMAILSRVDGRCNTVPAAISAGFFLIDEMTATFIRKHRGP